MFSVMSGANCFMKGLINWKKAQAAQVEDNSLKLLVFLLY